MTISLSDHNMKLREVYCFKCNEYSDSLELTPKCHVCSSNLFTVIYDIITGIRVTGNNELAKRFNGST